MTIRENVLPELMRVQAREYRWGLKALTAVHLPFPGGKTTVFPFSFFGAESATYANILWRLAGLSPSSAAAISDTAHGVNTQMCEQVHPLTVLIGPNLMFNLDF